MDAVEAATSGLSARLEEAARNSGSVAELSRRSGVSESAIRKWIRGASEPSAGNLLAVAYASGLHPHWLLTGVLPKRVVDSPYESSGDEVSSTFEVVRSMSVRYENVDEETIAQQAFELRMAFSKDWLQRNGLDQAKLFLQDARDDSMSPSINPGDIMLIRGFYDGFGSSDGKPGMIPDSTFTEEGIFYLKPAGAKHAIRRLQPDLEGGFLLSTDNPNRPDIKVPGDKLTILGKVEWIGRRL